MRHAGRIALLHLLLVALSPTPSQATGGSSTNCYSATSWCPELGECIQPWDKSCPIDGDTFVGPTQLLCYEGRCSSNEKCSWMDSGAVMATYYFTGMAGVFDLPNGCTTNCTGCETAPEDDERPAIADVANPASVNCVASGGSIEIKYGPDGGEYGVCVLGDGTACEEWALAREECEEGSDPVFLEYCDDIGGRLTVEGAPAVEYAVCTYEDGTECVEHDYYGGKCVAPEDSITADPDTLEGPSGAKGLCVQVALLVLSFQLIGFVSLDDS